MRLDKLKTLKVHSFAEGRLRLSNENEVVADLWYGKEEGSTGSDFADEETALRAAARFRASEVMYQALDRAKTLLDNLLKDGIDYEGVGRELAEISAALALAENTTEQVEITEP